MKFMDGTHGSMKNLCFSGTTKYTDDDMEKVWHITNIINDVNCTCTGKYNYVYYYFQPHLAIFTV